MATRKVILTERELTSLIRRIIRETEEMDSNNEASKQDVTKALASFFKKEVLPELSSSEKNKIMRKADMMEMKELEEMSLYEADEDEEEDEDADDIKSRKSNFKDKLMTRGGFTMAALGLVGVIGRSMGWSEFETTTKIFQFMEELGTGQYSGPITVAMIAAGLGMAIKGIANKYNRENK
jgi:hypothetical protein